MPAPYQGPISLGSSRFAPPQHQTRAAAFSPMESKANGLMTLMDNGTALVSHDAKVRQNADAQLAIAQNENLKKEVEQHSRKVTTAVSSSIANTRQFLTLLQESIRKEKPASAEAELKAVEGMWGELEKLHNAALEAKAALPTFLEKQKGNMSLYHTSKVNEAYQDSQEELNAQHKKVNLQHNLILEHQQAFQDYKANVEPQLEEAKELQERVSRLTLEKGAVKEERGEMEAKWKATEAEKEESTKKIEEVQEELDAAIAAKSDMSTEVEHSRQTISELQEKVKAAEQKATDHYEAEIRRVTKQYENASARTKDLDGMVKTLQDGQTEKVAMLTDKYKDQTEAYAILSADSKAKQKEIATLAADLKRLQDLNQDLNAKLAKLDTLEKEVVEARKALAEQTAELQARLETAQKEANEARESAKSISQKLKQAEKDNEELEEENNELLSKAAEHKKKAAALSASLADNAKLNAEVQELQQQLTNRVVVSDDTAAQEQIDAGKVEIESLKKHNAEWQALANRSYKEFKDLQPKAKQSDALRAQNEQLKALLAAKASSNAGGGGKDVAYWRSKYEDLLSSLD